MQVFRGCGKTLGQISDPFAERPMSCDFTFPVACGRALARAVPQYLSIDRSQEFLAMRAPRAGSIAASFVSLSRRNQEHSLFLAAM
ncbi:hypothetical protein [Dongia sp.]|uniref:hypothetical protein n=1 Tax=Dongia sp. TaxID=1977262 RepID=UPI0035B3F881